MTSWHDLVVAATVGTASRPVDLAATPPAVLAAAPPGHDRAGSLLDAAVAFTVAQRAGRRPAHGEIPPPPASDPRPTVSRTAAGLVASVLVDRELDLAALALGEVAGSGRRLPDSLVPAALGLASRHAALRPSTLAACGPVAPWLAAQNPAWAWAARVGPAARASFEPARWETGDRAERLAQLRALYASDPAAAVTLLDGAWRATAPDERADLLAVLGPVPPASAEALLEAALDDRRAPVARAAAAMLARVEGSGFRRRAADRAGRLLRVERRGLRRVLVLTAPAAFDAADRRDGLQEAPGTPQALGTAATAGTGPIAGRVRQLVAAAPLVTWEQATGCAPAELAAMAVDRFGDEVRAGWLAATRHERDPRWAAALLPVARAQAGETPHSLAALVAILPPEARTRTVAGVFSHDDPAGVAAVLPAVPTPWDDDVAARFVRWWRRAVRTTPGRELAVVLPLAGRGLPATAEYAALLRDTAEHAPVGAVWMRAARAAADTIDLRRRLHEELA